MVVFTPASRSGASPPPVDAPAAVTGISVSYGVAPPASPRAVVRIDSEPGTALRTSTAPAYASTPKRVEMKSTSGSAASPGIVWVTRVALRPSSPCRTA